MERSVWTVDQALGQSAALPWAYIRTLSEVYLGKNPGKTELAELIEARYFGEDQEIRIFSRQGEWAAACILGQEGDDVLEERCPIANKKFGGELTLVRHLDRDEDGQTYVCATRLKKWKGAEAHG